VSKKDRALAVKRLKEINRWNNRQAADALGISSKTVKRWLEPTKQIWEGTAVDPSIKKKTGTNENERLSKKIDKTNEEIPANIRRMADSSDEAEELLKKAIVENDLNRNEVIEAKKKAKAGKNPEIAIQEVAQDKEEQVSTTQKVKIETTLTNDTAVAIKSFAKDHGMTTNDVAEQAIEKFLSDNGEL